MRAIDLFAGLGGVTAGARAAGVDVVWAANHWEVAVKFHAANHPDTAHSCQDLAQANFTKLPPFELLLASPSCQGHSLARGVDMPYHDDQRATAWAVIACVEVNQPELVVVENVVPFRDKWKLYPVWKNALETYGYHVTENVVDAADFGVPQNRERIFVVASKRKPITVEAPMLDHVPASSFLDLESGNWGPVRKPKRAARTLAQVEAGWREFGAEPFLIPYYGNGSGLIGRSTDRPIGVIPTGDRWAVVVGDLMRMLTLDEYRQAMGFPETYVLPRTRRPTIKLLGNAVCPAVATSILEQVQAEAA